MNFNFIKQELSTFDLEAVMKDKALMTKVRDELTLKENKQNLFSMLPALNKKDIPTI